MIRVADSKSKEDIGESKTETREKCVMKREKVGQSDESTLLFLLIL